MSSEVLLAENSLTTHFMKVASNHKGPTSVPARSEDPIVAEDHLELLFLLLASLTISPIPLCSFQ